MGGQGGRGARRRIRLVAGRGREGGEAGVRGQVGAGERTGGGEGGRKGEGGGCGTAWWTWYVEGGGEGKAG